MALGDAELGLSHVDAAVEEYRKGNQRRLARLPALQESGPRLTRWRARWKRRRPALAEARRINPEAHSQMATNSFDETCRRCTGWPAQGGVAGGMRRDPEARGDPVADSRGNQACGYPDAAHRDVPADQATGDSLTDQDGRPRRVPARVG